MEYGDRLRKLREEFNLSQKELTDRLHINRSTYARYETSSTQPDFDTLNKLADFFGVSTDYLLGRIPVKNQKMFENAGITNDEYKSLNPYQKEVVDFFLTRENLQFYDRPERLLDALEQFEVFYEFWKKQQEQKDEE